MEYQPFYRSWAESKTLLLPSFELVYSHALSGHGRGHGRPRLHLLRAALPRRGGDEAQPPPSHGGLPRDRLQVQRGLLERGQQAPGVMGIRGSRVAGGSPRAF